MRIEADQRWGVGVVADAGTTFANKNGWLSIDDSNGSDEDDNGLWAVTSVGVVTVHGQTVLMAAFSQHQPSMAAGVTLVQDLARAIIPGRDPLMIFAAGGGNPRTRPGLRSGPEPATGYS